MADFTELKKKQRATWALGEYDRIAEGLHSVSDHVMRVARLRPGERVLDVATGTGITALNARARGAKVTALDLTPELLNVARKKAEAEGYTDIEFKEGDAEAMPFPDASFDVVLSTCGHMFAPDQAKVGAELLRVTKPGGRIVFQAWSPDGGLAGWFRITNQYAPPPAGVPPPFNWGNPDKVRELLGRGTRDLRFEHGDCPQIGASPEDVFELFATAYGPTVRALSTLDEAKREAFRRDALAFLKGYQAVDGKVRWGREYLVTRATRA
ncbi:MAG TPA: methyltransferase domain-containing protein [Candidatus Thermoplasmatota archaeon]|nr:methyltransferase domain-containing protein [Candidatus Thermoplasmatota archaeon]